jgi:hypothetical protein
VPLKTDRLVRPFPVDVFPEWLADQVTAVAEATQTPLDLAASVVLACLSTAAGGKVLVRVDRSWVEQVNLYTVTALPTGSRKSPVFRAVTSPLSVAEEALREQAAERRLEAEPATQVAEWAGHSVNVLLKVYAKCLDGQDEAAMRRIEAALIEDEPAPVSIKPGTWS